MKNTLLTEEIGRLLSDVRDRREQIKEEYIKAWLAAAVPADELTMDYIIKNVRIVEKWSDDRLTVKWHLEIKQ